MVTAEAAENIARRSRLRAILDHALGDNATALRELSQRATPSLILAIVVFCVLQGLAFVSGARSNGQLLAAQGVDTAASTWSWFLWSCACLAMAGYVGVERAASLFDWERRQDCLDQHVTTGSSPLRVIEGKLTVAAMETVVMLLVSTPFALALHLIHDVPVGHLLASMAGALFCGFACLGISVWCSTYFEDIGAGFVTALVAVILLAVAMKSGQRPGHLGALLPVYPLLERIRSTLDATTPVAQMFGHPTPGWLVFALTYGSIGALGLCAGALGPPAVEGKLGRTFGTLIVRSGGRRRAVGDDITRRMSDLRFLYQNRAAWLCRHEGLLRQLHWLLALVLFMTLGLGLSWHLLAVQQSGSQLIGQLLAILCVPILWAVISAAVSAPQLQSDGARASLRISLWTSLVMLCLPILFLISGYPFGGAVDESYLKLTALTVLMQSHGLLLIALGVLVGATSPARSHTILLQMAAAVLLYAAVPYLALECMRLEFLDARGFLALELSMPYVISQLIDNEVLTLAMSHAGEVTAVDFHFDAYRAAALACALTVALAVLAAWRHLRVRSRATSETPRSGIPGAQVAALGLIAISLLGGSAAALEIEAAPDAKNDPAAPRLEVEIGWEGEATGVFIPVCVTVTAGTRPYSGLLEVEEEYSRQSLWSGSVDLKPGAIRRVRLTTSIGRGGVRAVLSTTAPGVEDLYARGIASSMGGWMWGGLLFVDREALAPLEVLSTRSPVSLHSCRPEHLCEVESAVRGIGCIILGRAGIEDFDPVQIEMLRRYVARGGCLVVTPGTGGAALARSFGPQMATWIDAARPRAFERPLGLCEILAEESLTGQPLQLADLEPALAIGGSAELVSDDTVLLASFGYGRGKVMQLACDLWSPPLANTRLATCLSSLLVDSVRWFPSDATKNRRGVLQEGGSQSSLLWMSWVLVVLAMTLVPYLLARRIGRSQAIWYLVPLGVVLALGIVLATSSLLNRLSSRVALDSMSWWSAGVEQGVTDYHLSLVSRGRTEATVTLPGECPDAIALPASGISGSVFSSWQALSGLPAPDGRTTRFSEFEISRWQANLLLTTVEDPPEPPAHARLIILGPKEVHLRLEGLSTRLECVMLYASRRQTFVGSMLRPDETEIVLTRPESGRPFVRKQLGPRRDRASARRLDDQVTLQFASTYNGAHTLAGEARLYARVPRSGRRLPPTEHSVEHPGLHLISIPVELDAAPGTEFDISEHMPGPRSVVTLRPGASAPEAIGSYDIFTVTLPRTSCRLEPIRIVMPEPPDRRRGRRRGGSAPPAEEEDVDWVEVWDIETARWAPVEAGAAGAVIEEDRDRRLDRIVYAGDAARRLVEPRTGRIWFRCASRDGFNSRRGYYVQRNRGLLREIIVRAELRQADGVDGSGSRKR